MTTKYDIRAALRNDQRAKDVALLNKVGAQQAAQNFIDSYMSPTEMSDLINRLGTIITATDEILTVSDNTFPPFNLDITRTGLGVRAGGFKQLNDKINDIQLTYRSLTGEIRTKITEWDLSLYLQELWIDDLSMFDLSLLYRIFVDNPSGYTDSRALAYGILNAALSFQYKDSSYNPAADPDLMYWVPPTEDLLASQNWEPPRGHYEVTRSGGINVFGWKAFRKTKSVWVWDIPPSPPMNDWQKEQVRLATAGGWNSWNPQFWQLFFNSENPAMIDHNDFTHIVNHLSKLMKKRRSRAPMPKVKPTVGSSTFIAPGETGSQLGLNTQSPIWYGLPYGRYPDPRSIQGYLQNRDIPVPKIDITGDTGDGRPINTAYPFGNPTDGIRKLLLGWQSTFPIITYVQTTQQVFHPNTSNRGRRSDGDFENGDDSYYSTVVITTPQETTGTTPVNTTTMKPEASGFITLASSAKRTISQKVFGYLGETTNNTGDRGGRGSGEDRYEPSPIESWGWKELEQDINPQTTLQIDHFNNIDVDSILGGVNIAKPVILTGSPTSANGAIPFVVIGTLQKVQTVLTSSRRLTFLWWSWTATTTTKKWVYQLDMNPGQGFSLNTGSLNIDVANPHLPLQYFKDGAFFTGVFFGLPARTLTPTSNVITDGWTLCTPAQGAAIATALLNPMWFNGQAYLRSPLHRILDSLERVLAPIANTLDTLQALFAAESGAVITNIINQFSSDVQAKAEIQSARTLFSNNKRGQLLTQVESATSSFSTLITAINNIRANRGIYLYRDLNTFYTMYPIVIGALTDSTTLRAIQAYLNVLYEERLLLLSKRLNKETGTLVNTARAEFALALMQDSLAESPRASDLLVQSKLPIRHSVTNISLMERASLSVLPVEKLRIVYVRVNYTDAGEIIRPPAGAYNLYSQEVLNDTAITPAQWYIVFEGEFAPPILKDVITTLDGQRLQQIITNPNLTDLEKVCYARTLEDWWEIKIPESSQPLAEFYKTGMQLILMYPDAYIDQYLQITSSGIAATSPVVDSTTRLEIGATWVASDSSQEALKALNP